ncbi:MAG: N-acetyl-gamma-glutamyl-phosphate reductase [Gemmatimonadota bacterium]
MRVSVAGATGYAGGELLRLLIRHPEVELVHLAAGERAGASVGEVWPNLEGLLEATFTELDGAGLGAASEIVVTALPDGLALDVVPEILAEGARVVDVGPDFRLGDPDRYRRHYGREHTAPALLDEAVYGLSEWSREELDGARLVANPGCYPTAAGLALLPLARFGWVGGGVIVDAKSGVTGAGRGARRDLQFGEVAEDLRPYGVLEHRHVPEIRRALFGTGNATSVAFVPHLVPMTRGMLATCYVPLATERSPDEALELFRAAYADAPFVRVLDGLPRTKATAGSNFCDLTVRIHPGGRMAVVIAALDNLGKGAAGQAVQNMNLMCGLDETAGLWEPPYYP